MEASERRGAAASLEIIKHESLDALNSYSGTNPGFYQEGKKLWLRMPALKTGSDYYATFGPDQIITGVEQAGILSNMTLEYGAGLLTYSVDENAKDAVLEIYSVTGALMSSHTDLETDGYAHQIQTDLPDGIYIATLTVSTPDGGKKTKTIKIAVR